MTAAELRASADTDSSPPEGLSPLAEALWFAHASGGKASHSHWTSSHNIAQDIHTKLGSWTHALLHLIEGDQWNADYWFSRASKPSRKPKDIDALWAEIAAEVLS
jgi:hypothetical protein